MEGKLGRIVKMKPETLAVVKERAAAGCRDCARVLEALDEDEVLRDWPLGATQPEFPVLQQRAHVVEERDGAEGKK